MFTDRTEAGRRLADRLSHLRAHPDVVVVGLPREAFEQVGADPQVLSAVRGAVAELESAGAKSVPVTLPHMGYAIAAYRSDRANHPTPPVPTLTAVDSVSQARVLDHPDETDALLALTETALGERCENLRRLYSQRRENGGESPR